MDQRTSPRRSYAPSVRSGYLRENWSRFKKPPRILASLYHTAGARWNGEALVTGLVIIAMALVWPMYVLADTGFYLRTALTGPYSRIRKRESIPFLLTVTAGSFVGRAIIALEQALAPVSLTTMEGLQSTVFAYCAAAGILALLWPSCYSTEMRGLTTWRWLFGFTGGLMFGLVLSLAFAILGSGAYATPAALVFFILAGIVFVREALPPPA